MSPTSQTATMRDLSAREAWVVAPLLAVIIALGFYPKPLLDVINPADRAHHAAGRRRPTRSPSRPLPKESR